LFRSVHKIFKSHDLFCAVFQLTKMSPLARQRYLAWSGRQTQRKTSAFLFSVSSPAKCQRWHCYLTYFLSLECYSLPENSTGQTVKSINLTFIHIKYENYIMYMVLLRFSNNEELIISHTPVYINHYQILIDAN